MDNNRLIYIADTKAEIEQILAAIDGGMSTAYFGAQGYNFDQEGLIGKKAGKDNPDAARTTTYSEIYESPDNRFYMYSLSNNPKLKNGTQQLKDAGFKIREVKILDEWLDLEDIS